MAMGQITRSTERISNLKTNSRCDTLETNFKGSEEGEGRNGGEKEERENSGKRYGERGRRTLPTHKFWLKSCTGTLGLISYRLRDRVHNYSLKLCIENCGQTTANGDMVTTDSL